MPQFKSTYFLAQIFWLMICFGVLWSAMQFWVFPKLHALQKNRKKSLEQKIEEAKLFQHRAELLMKETHDYLEQSRQEAAVLIHEGLHTSQDSLQKVIHGLKEVHHAKIELFKNELIQKQDEVLARLSKEVPALVDLYVGIKKNSVQEESQPTL
jgi:F0F1-type ATP synthase membrane subunit b/b'